MSNLQRYLERKGLAPKEPELSEVVLDLLARVTHMRFNGFTQFEVENLLMLSPEQAEVLWEMAVNYAPREEPCEPEFTVIGFWE